MARIWDGKLQLSAAINAGTLELSGPRGLRQAFRSWLLLSPFAQGEAAEPGHRSRGHRPDGQTRRVFLVR
jgi:hypothetical protein